MRSIIVLQLALTVTIAACDTGTPLPSPDGDAPACDLAPPPGDVTFEWHPCPGAPSGFAECYYVDQAGQRTCRDDHHMPAFGVTCVASCEVSQ